jgi:glutathione synthase/RimK-type ligase-like ATP-grasp enzyme
MFNKIIVIQFQDVDGSNIIRDHYKIMNEFLVADEFIVVRFDSSKSYLSEVGHIKNSLVYIQSNYVDRVKELIDILDLGNNKYYKVDMNLVEFFNSKWLCYEFLEGNEFKQQKTFGIDDHNLSYPYVIKSDEGYKGEKVWLINSHDDYHKVIKGNTSDRLIVQEYNSNSYGKDIRVIIFPKFNLYYRRVGADGSWKSNVGWGSNRGHRESMKSLPMVVEEGIERLKKSIYREFPSLNRGGEYFAIDVFDDEDFNIIEMNYNPGWSPGLLGMFPELNDDIVEYIRSSIQYR